MAKAAGRKFFALKNNVKIASIRTTGMTIDNQPIETTNNDDDAFQSFLANEFGLRSMSVNVEGYIDDDLLFDAAISTTHGTSFFSDITLQRPNGDVIAGTFILTNITETGAHNEAASFTATLVRSGAHTFTPA